MTAPYTPTPAGSIASRTLAAIASMMAGSDAPNGANTSAPIKELADRVATLFSRGVLLELANALIQPGTAVASFSLTGSAPTSVSTAARVLLLGPIDSVLGKIRFYLVYQSSTRVGIEVTVNAAWSNGTALWTADAAGYATRWRFNQADASNLFPTVDTDYKSGLAAGGTYSESSFSWGGDKITALTGINGTFSSLGSPAIGKRQPSGDVIINLKFVATAAVTAGSSICNTWPAGWSIQGTGQQFPCLTNNAAQYVTLAGGSLTSAAAMTAGQTLYASMAFTPGQ